MKDKIIVDLSKDKKREIYTINIDGEELKVPIFVSINAWIKYGNAYKDTNDYKMAFIYMIIEIIYNCNDNTYEKLEPIKNLLMKESINKELINIMEKIINKEQFIKEYFDKNNSEFTYENFYKAYQYQNKKFGEIVSESVKPIIESMATYKEQIRNVATNLGSLFITPKFEFPKLGIPKLNNYQFDNIIQPTINNVQVEDYVERYNLDSETLKLYTQEDLCKEVIKTNEKFSENINYIYELLEIAREEQEARKISERSSSRKFTLTLLISIISLIVAIVSFWGKDSMVQLINQLK